MADMGILANFRQAGAAGQGAWRLYYMGKANQRAEEQHQQQSEMNEMKMQQEQQKMQQQQEMEKLKEDWVNAQTPEQKKIAAEQLQIRDPKYYNQVQQSIGLANKNQIQQYEQSVKTKLPYFAVIDQLDKQGKKNQAEAAFGAMKKNLSEIPGVDMKSVPNTFYGPTGAKQSGWFDIESAKGRYTSDAIKNRLKELELQSADRYRKDRVKIAQQKADSYERYLGLRKDDMDRKKQKELQRQQEKNTYKPLSPGKPSRQQLKQSKGEVKRIIDELDDKGIDVDSDFIKQMTKDYNDTNARHGKHPLADKVKYGEGAMYYNLHPKMDKNGKLSTTEWEYNPKRSFKGGKTSPGILYIIRNMTNLDEFSGTVEYNDYHDMDHKNKGAPRTKKIKLNAKQLQNFKALMKKYKF